VVRRPDDPDGREANQVNPPNPARARRSIMKVRLFMATVSDG
jgi:hypothetical protein